MENQPPIVIHEGVSIYRIIGIVVAFIIFASLMSYSENILAIDFMKYYNYIMGGGEPEKSATKHEDETRSGPEPIQKESPLPPPSENIAASAEQFWCLVGEDMVGRWCVQVLAANMCPTERTYAYKNACEKGPV